MILPHVYIKGDRYGLLVTKGTNDPQGHPDIIYVQAGAGVRKTLVTYHGANHWGYTDLCHDDGCVPGIASDGACTFGWKRQQQATGAYIAALMRFYGQSDTSVTAYLNGARQIELDGVGAIDVSVVSAGY